MLKCSSERWVCAPHSLSLCTSTSPRLSVSLRIPITEILLIAVIASLLLLQIVLLGAQPHTSLHGPNSSSVFGELPALAIKADTGEAQLLDAHESLIMRRQFKSHWVPPSALRRKSTR